MPLAVGVAGAVAVVGFAIYLGVSRRRRRPSPQLILERLLNEPPRESPLGSAVKAAARALAVKALQAVAERAVERLTEASHEPLQLHARRLELAAQPVDRAAREREPRRPAFERRRELGDRVAHALQ